MKVKNLKRFIILLIILGFWDVIYALVIKQEKVQVQKSVSQYVLINSYTCWKYTNSRWEELNYSTNYNKVSEELNWKEYDIYIGNSYYNTLQYVVKDGEEFYFDKDTRSYEVNEEKIMFNTDSYLKLIDFSKMELSNNDYTVINNMLQKYDLSDSDITVMDKYFIDNDNAVYIVSNYTGTYSIDFDNLFYLIFYRRYNKNYLIDKTSFIENVSDYELTWVVDAKNKFNNFIISMQCEQAKCYRMYQYNKGKYVEVFN